MQNFLPVVLTLLVALTSKSSFVDTTPASKEQIQNGASEQDETVQELENLKNSIGTLGETLNYIKTKSSHFSDVDGEKQADSEVKEEVKENGEVLAKIGQHSETTFKEDVPKTEVDTEVEIPSKGIHKTLFRVLKEDAERSSMTPKDNMLKRQRTINLNRLSEAADQDKVDSSAVSYSPVDVAEYVFWTGDEKGVTAAIEEFLQGGLMSKEEAIVFLQEIKYHLDKLRNHYIQMGFNNLQKSKALETAAEISQQQQQKQSAIDFSSVINQAYYDKPEQLRTNFNVKQLRQEANKKRSAMAEQQAQAMLAFEKSTENGNAADDEYDELLERLKLADLLYTEYSLEEVVYQLAKLMFAQSLTKGSVEAEQALQKFTDFLEMETAQGRISKALEKKVLDILVAAISDTLREHPESLVAEKENMENQNFIGQYLDPDMEERLSIRDMLALKEQSKTKQHQAQTKEKLSNHFPFNFLKYKSA